MTYRIKPLEWVQRDTTHWASGPNREYAVWSVGRFGSYYHMPEMEQGRQCESPEAGKAACEADWQKRLAAVLEPAPSTAEVLESLMAELTQKRAEYARFMEADCAFGIAISMIGMRLVAEPNKEESNA